MDAVFDKPFGNCSPEDLVMGRGSESCMFFIQNDPLNHKYNKSKKGDDTGEVNNFAAVLRDIIECVKDPNQVPDRCLLVAGYKRTPHGVVNLVNGALFDAKDAEHWMCKLYYQVKFTSPNYLCTAKPKAAKDYCWPQRFRQEDADNICIAQTDLKRLMELACATFLDIMTPLKLPPSDMPPSEKQLLDKKKEQLLLTLPDIVILQNEEVQRPLCFAAIVA